jgi:hypothetical protein
MVGLEVHNIDDTVLNINRLNMDLGYNMSGKYCGECIHFNSGWEWVTERGTFGACQIDLDDEFGRGNDRPIVGRNPRNECRSIHWDKFTPIASNGVWKQVIR